MNNNKWNKIIFLLAGISMLSSCTEMNSQFDCPMKPGIRCESLDRINERIDSGEFRKKSSPCANNLPAHPCKLSKVVSSPALFKCAEQTRHIWIAPYVDSDGNFHDGNSIYTSRKFSDKKDINHD